MSLIECNNINRYFGSGENRVHVLKNISLSVEKGDFVAIIGQSGSGKSTLMNILGCLDTASSGSYRVEGTETSAMSADELAGLRRKRFGFIFQRYNLLSAINARDDVALPGGVCRHRARRAGGARQSIAGRFRAGGQRRRQTQRAFRRPAAAREHCARADERR